MKSDPISTPPGASSTDYRNRHPWSFDNLPTALRERDQFLLWREEIRNDRTTKVPYAPSGERAKVNDPATWLSFNEAVAVYERGNFDGVGLVLTKKDPFAGVDLDHCRNLITAQIDPWALEIVRKLDSYTECSPSGDGLRIFVLGTLPPSGRKRDDIEMYDSGRFLTVTGHRLEGARLTVEQRDEALLALHAEVFGHGQEIPTRPERPVQAVRISDTQLLDKARRAKNGHLFSALHDQGDTSGYPSPSEADQALCAHLVFWTGGDDERIDRLFRGSALFRAKWDERRSDSRTYGEFTIARALCMVNNFYTSSRHSS